MIIPTIATNTFKEAVRDKVLYNLLIFTLVIISASVLLGRLTIGQDERVIKDMGLASMSLFGVLIATFVGTNLVHKELNKKTIYTLISKPIRRYEFILGKYCGLLLTLIVNLAIMTLVLFLVILIHRLIFPPPLQGREPIGYIAIFKAVSLIFFELMLITSIAILFSTISTPTLSVFFTLAIYVIGHLTVDIKELGATSGNGLLKTLCSLSYYLLPNLENFNIRAEMVRDVSVSHQFIIYSIVYGILYMAAVLLISIMSMERKEFV
jgi:ABC-type transport system involved in multi-copper enzyme maturation permease subunit